jgi:hypothetical protein
MGKGELVVEDEGDQQRSFGVYVERIAGES